MIDALSKILDTFERAPHLPLRFALFGILQLWGCFNINALAATSAAPLPMLGASIVYQNVYVGAQIAVFALFAAMAPRFSPYLRRNSLFSGALGAAYASSTLILWGTQAPLPPVLFCATAILAGWAYAYFFLLWVELLGCVSGSKMVSSYLLATMVYYAGSIINHYVYFACNAVFYLLFPLVFTLGYVMSLRSLAPEALPLPMTCSYRLPWRIVLFVCAFSMVFDLSGGFYLFSLTDIFTRMGRLVPIVVILLLALFDRKFDFSLFYRIVIVLMLLGLVARLFFHGITGGVADILVQAGAEAYSFLLFIIVSSYAYRLKVSSTRFYGTVAALNLTVQSLFNLLTALFPEILHGTVVSVAVCVVGIGVLFFLMNQPGLFDEIQPLPPEPRQAADALALFADQRGLSPRERMILGCVMEGLNTAIIGERLFISPSTVRYHLSEMYRKCGVHSREELRGLLDAEMSRNS